MAKIVTGELQEGSDKVQKTLQPGNTVIKINSISIKKEPFEGDPINIVLSCEGKPLEGFEGFLINKDQPELGSHLGQVGNVRAQPYSFSNRVDAQGKAVNRDTELTKWLMQFCKVIDKVEWLKSQGDFDTVEELVEHVNKLAPYKDMWLSACLGGKAYQNKQGFLNYDLYLPWFRKDGVPLEVEGKTPSNLIKFDKQYHIMGSGKKKAESVESFEGKKKPGAELEL